MFKLCRYKFDVIEINYWNENKELCLWKMINSRDR